MEGRRYEDNSRACDGHSGTDIFYRLSTNLIQ
jgi:hypothetical protein